uniref:Uncharacterized protein n=1 Tax=Arundo donax TaxID=35708 RepID=A0A0A9HTU3_ARUDO
MYCCIMVELKVYQTSRLHSSPVHLYTGEKNKLHNGSVDNLC